MFIQNHPNFYISNKAALKNLMEAGVTDISELVTEQNTLKSLENITEEFASWNAAKQTHLKKQICKQDSREIKDYIIKRRVAFTNWEFEPEQFYFDEEYQGYEITIDESLKENKAGYGIYLGRKHKYNFYSRVEGEQTLQNATYQGILHVLKGFPVDEPIIFILDRESVIKVMENFPTRHKDKQNSLHLDVLNQIEEMLAQRIAPIQYKHVYSHTADDPKNEKDLAKQLQKKEKMYLKYGEERADRYIKNNQKVDKLADKGRDSEEIYTPKLNKYMNDFVLTTIRK